MLELIRASAVPSNLMQSAARGALSVPPQEMIEILVHLATKNKVFGEQASLTLAGWDETSSRAAASDPSTPREVLEYLIDSRNLRPVLLPALLENPSVPEASVLALAGSISRDMADNMLKSKRVNSSREIMSALVSNPNLTGIQSTGIEERISALAAASSAEVESAKNSETRDSQAGVTSAAPMTPPAAQESATTEAATPETGPDMADEEIAKYLAEHASEIAAEAAKPFQPIGGTHEELDSAEAAQAEAKTGTPAAPTEAPEPEFKRPALKKSILTEGEKRGSALQKIAKLDITGRIQLAMKGTKEERALLVRDGTKIVALSVLESPKLSDGEVEKFAGQKNVLEAVLRAIPMKRRFIKQYGVIRNLVSNPRTPIDVSLGLVKHLMLNDLKHLSGNKEVSDTIRKLANKMFRQKLDTTKKSTD
ncbi:MAG: hypothetical protein WB421_01115 [Terriglobales bacterium]